MKISENFVLREIAGEYIIVPVGNATLNFNGLMTVNEVGRFIWQQLQNDITKEALVEKIIEEYDVDRETAKADTEEFIEKLKQNGIL